MDLLDLGTQVNGVYQVEWKLGEGAFAEVWRVNHRFLGRQAMKVFKQPGATETEIHGLLQEARLLSQYSHPNLVQVFDAGVLNWGRGSIGYFTMTHVAGGTLEGYWSSFGAQFMPIEQVVEIGRQVCRGLEVAHCSQPPIIHRDIKPQNILVGFGAMGLQVRLSDFGLAKQVSRLSLLASARGTPAYKSPESLSDGDSAPSDIWAIGATLYKLMTDRLPYPIGEGDDWNSGDHFKRPLKPPSTYNIQVDDGLDAIVLRCLAVDPKHRYQNATELLAALEAWVPGKRRRVPSPGESMAISKSSLGGCSETSRKAGAQELVERALENAASPSRLMEAADLLEAALTQDPKLAKRYESRLKLWRRGINM